MAGNGHCLNQCLFIVSGTPPPPPGANAGQILMKYKHSFKTWWRHQMEIFSALLAICARNSPVPDEFPAQRPVTRSFDVFFDLRLNKRLSKQSWGRWFETPSRSLWRHRNECIRNVICKMWAILFSSQCVELGRNWPVSPYDQDGGGNLDDISHIFIEKKWNNSHWILYEYIMRWMSHWWQISTNQ